jgi:hypothetical protein
MDNGPLNKALAKLEWHRGEITRLEQFIATYREFELETDSPSDGEGAGAVDLVSEAPTSTAKVLQEAEDVLRHSSGPMAAADIFNALVRRGIKIVGKNPQGNMTAKFATRRNVFAYDSESGRWSLRK